MLIQICFVELVHSSVINSYLQFPNICVVNSKTKLESGGGKVIESDYAHAKKS